MGGFLDNDRRQELIEQKLAGQLSMEAQAELAALQAAAIAYRERVAPTPLEGALHVQQELLIRLAAEYPPPQEWFDEDETKPW